MTLYPVTWSTLALLTVAASGKDTMAPLCDGLPECSIHERWAAGGELHVVETRRPARNADAIECIEGAREFWLLDGDTASAPARRILRLCNDGYGIAGIGEDSIEVEPGKLTHTRYGGSNWRTLTRTEIALEPISIAAVQTDTRVSTAVGCQRHLGLPASARRMSWLEPVQVDEHALRGDCEFERQADALDIPQLSSGFLEPQAQARLNTEFERWKQARYTLGDCALEFGTAQLPAAYVLNARIDPTQPARLKVLALDEVHWIIGVHAPAREPLHTSKSSSGKWIHRDRLELWLGGFQFTWPEDIEAPVQYGLTLDDGQVHRGAGASTRAALPLVEQWRQDEWRWYAIDLTPARPDWKVFSASVVYGEGDGRSQGLMLGSSKLSFGKASTLGGLWTDYSHHCEIRDGVLVRAALKPQFADPDHFDPLAPIP